MCNFLYFSAYLPTWTTHRREGPTHKPILVSGRQGVQELSGLSAMTTGGVTLASTDQLVMFPTLILTFGEMILILYYM